MKKTYKVNNILKSNKYNIKTELLLSALALLVSFGTVACKKDPVKPVNKEEPVKKTEEELKREKEQKNLKELEKLAKDAATKTENCEEILNSNVDYYKELYEKEGHSGYLLAILSYKSAVEMIRYVYIQDGLEPINNATMTVLHKRCDELLKEENFKGKLLTSSPRVIKLSIQKQR